MVVRFKTRRKHHDRKLPGSTSKLPSSNNNNKSFLLAHCHIYGKQLRPSLLNNKSYYLGTYSTGNTVESQGDDDIHLLHEHDCNYKNTEEYAAGASGVRGT